MSSSISSPDPTQLEEMLRDAEKAALPIIESIQAAVNETSEHAKDALRELKYLRNQCDDPKQGTIIETVYKILKEEYELNLVDGAFIETLSEITDIDYDDFEFLRHVKNDALQSLIPQKLASSTASTPR